MEPGQAYCFQGKESKQEVKLLTIACRFIPYDQWLVTHVDPSWTINEVKLWILAKCIANGSRSNSSSTFNLPPIHPPNKPKTKPSRRPASPIVFAEFPPSNAGPSHSPGYNSERPVEEVKPRRKKRRSRGRPISPITFAPIGAVDYQDDSEDDNVKSKDEGEVIGMGYEEDDEWDSQEDESELELELDPNPRMGRRANRNQYLGFYDRPSVDQPSILPPSSAPRILPGKTLVNPASFPRGSFTTYHPNLLNLIRFSTGQILEKHYTILDYEIKPYELLEIHRLGVVTKLPREIIFEYMKPYWEGWAKALRLVFREPRVFTGARSQVHEGPGRRKEPSVDEMSKTALDGTYTTKSVSSHADTARKTMEVLAGGPVKVAPFSPADVALGLRSPSDKSMKKSKHSVGNNLDIHTSVLKSAKLSNSSHHGATPLSRNATASTSKSGFTQNMTSNSYRSKGKGGKLEWRERWLFIKDGVLYLKKENSESTSTTTQMLPLNSLTEIHNADQLGPTMPPSSSHWIVCAKFKTHITTRSTVSEPNDTAHRRHPSQSITNSKLHSTLKSPVTLTRRSSLSRGGSLTQPRGDLSYTAPTGHRNPSTVLTRPPNSSTTTKPKIALQIQPHLPPASPKVIPITESLLSMSIASQDKGKGKMRANPPSASECRIASDPEVPSGPASENPSEAHTGEDGAASDDEADATDIKRKQRIPAVPDRKHPQISIESDADSDDSGGTLSSPVFAHTEGDSPFSDEPARSYGYGYGHFGGTSELRRKGGGGSTKEKSSTMKRSGDEEDEENVEVDTSYVVVSEADDNPEDPGSIHASNTRLPPHLRRPSGNGEKPDPESEWIVLDLGDDYAFRSFLRVIHRHAPHVIDSAFLSSLAPFQKPKPNNHPVPAAPAPTPDFTSSFPSPENATSPIFGQWSWNTVRQEQVRRHVPDEISPITPTNELNPEPGPLVSVPTPLVVLSNTESSSVNDTPAGTQTPVSPINAPRDSTQFRLPPSPRLLGVRSTSNSDAQNPSLQTSPLLNTSIGHRQSETKQLNILSSQQKNFFGTYGALPYPEWRLEVITKAQRAGMGELTRAMDQFIWGDNPGLTLLTRELGLSLAPMEFIRSPSIQTAVGDRYSVDEERDSTGDVASTRRQRKREERKMTLEQENIAIGLNNRGNMSSKTLIKSGHHVPQRYMASISNVFVPGSNAEQRRSPLKPNYTDIDTSESGEESSDAEWLGWMADLHRQARLQREEDARLDRLETESLGSSTDTNHYWDYQQQDDHRRYQEERRALEPTGIVTSSSPHTIPTSPIVFSTAQQDISPISTQTAINHSFESTTSTGACAVSSTFHRSINPSHSGDLAAVGGPSVLTSPSSNESLGGFHDGRSSFGLSPSDPPSSATSPSLSQVGRSVEVSHHGRQLSRSHSNEHRRRISGMVRDGPNLSHYASTGLIGISGELRESELQNSGLITARRPSMPVLGISSTARPDGLSTLVPNFRNTGTTLGGLSVETRSLPGAKSAKSIGSQQSSENPVTISIPRRTSITGSVSSVGRSSSMLSKAPGLLRKKGSENIKARKTSEKEAVHYSEREMHIHARNQKERSWKGKDKDRDSDLVVQDFGVKDKSRRARLSLSLSTNQAYDTVSTSEVLSPSATSAIPASKGRIRHTSPGQHLLSDEDRNQVSVVKKEKKRGLVREKAERLLQNLESTLDFVDAR